MCLKASQVWFCIGVPCQGPVHQGAYAGLSDQWTPILLLGQFCASILADQRFYISWIWHIAGCPTGEDNGEFCPISYLWGNLHTAVNWAYNPKSAGCKTHIILRKQGPTFWLVKGEPLLSMEPLEYGPAWRKPFTIWLLAASSEAFNCWGGEFVQPAFSREVRLPQNLENLDLARNFVFILFLNSLYFLQFPVCVYV